MTRDSLVANAPRPFDAVCVHCKAETCAPTAVGSIERASGPPVALYACPHCVITATGPGRARRGCVVAACGVRSCQRMGVASSWTMSR
ncbi:hypothetical protein FQU76_13560 [Streptomyces qinzhouensis]|uniref:Uncharacterized protein n=1 Tax=Streptomyces qinzhouensis TaxID=2599401 RepID=A0A5B8IIY4_9ACTN|nr:hypothetical protein FQU76_13560 [Streptomyces qinzhouensis]